MSSAASTRVNKFLLSWQITRLRAKQTRDVEKKIQLVCEFLDGDANHQNYVRVRNWFEMTKIAYKEGSEERESLERVQLCIEHDKEFSGLYKNWDDETMELEQPSFELFYGYAAGRKSLLELYKDLGKRKYAFQYHGTPKDHVVFMQKLKDFLRQKGEIK